MEQRGPSPLKPTGGCSADHHDERCVAATRIWLVFVDDLASLAIIERPTVRHDPPTIALDRLACALRAEPDLLRRVAPTDSPAPRVWSAA